MSGSKYNSSKKTDQDMVTAIETSTANLVEEEDMEESPIKEASPTFGKISHLGPVSTKDRLMSKLERFSPYILTAILILLVFLLASVICNISKVGFHLSCSG